MLSVDQPLGSLKLFKKGMLKEAPAEISTIVLWFVLERKDHIEESAGKPNLNKLNMLLLKNRLDQWKKDVRL